MPDNKKYSLGNNTDIKNYVISKMSDIFRKIELFGSGINKVIDFTEGDFLFMDENIRISHSSSSDNVKISSDIAENISGNVVTDSIKELKNVLSQIKNFIDETGIRFKEGQKELSNVNKTLGDIVDNLTGFKSLVKHLRMLGISTKIESVRLGLEDRGFYTLAEDVEKLSTMITKKSLDIREKLTYLLNLVGNGKTTISNLIRTQNQYTSKIVEEALTSSDMLSEKYGQSAEKARIMANTSKDIYDEISKIVDSNRFQEIAKQQLVQIKSEFSDLSSVSKKKLTDFMGSNGGGESELFNEFKSSLKSQTENVKRFENNLDSAVENIRESYGTIDNYISSLSSDLHQFLNNTSFGQNSLLSEISEKLTTVSNTIQQDSKISDEMVTSMASVADTIADLSGFVDEIDEIGTEVELIALNASVKAARTGEEGAALGVLAESIQKLSIDAKSQTALIMEVLQSVMKIAEKLRNNFNSKSTDGKEEDLAALSAKIGDLLGNLKELDVNISSRAEELKESTSTLKDQIKQVSQKMGTDKKFRDTIDIYLQEFQEFINDSTFSRVEGFGENFNSQKGKRILPGAKKISQKFGGNQNPSKQIMEKKNGADGSNGFRNNLEMY